MIVKVILIIMVLLLLNALRIISYDLPVKSWEPSRKIFIIQEPTQPGFAIGYDKSVRLFYLKFWIWEIDISI